ncbi:kinase-like protein [Serendipita vermifera]|nr:kinase-like protein [Serendipita vermifera]
MRELRVWFKLRHKNILPLHGYCHDLGKQGALVSPWYQNGNVGHYIRPEDSSRQVAPLQRFNLWCGIIEGLAYLHANGVVHGDLKPTNVLVDDEVNARVCDFGLATIFSEEMVGATPTPVHSSTMRYLPFELIVAEDTVTPTEASDIYALGCLALEIIFLTSPYANRRNPAQIFRDVAKRDPPAQAMPIKDEPPPPILQELWNRLKACWNTDPKKRPSAQQLKAFVDENREELTQAVDVL